MERKHKNIAEDTQGTMRLFAARTSAKDLVVIEGSVLGGYLMLPAKDRMVPHLASELLDAGTRTKNKEVIRSALTNRGISLSFSSGADRTSFSATCLPEDAEFVLTLITECLSGAIFPTAEVVLQKKRTLAGLEEEKTKTRRLAMQEFLRTIYDPRHANYVETIQKRAAMVKSATPGQMRDFRKLLGTGGLVLAITGDIAPDSALTNAARIFASLPEGTTRITEKKPSTVQPISIEKRIPVPDKANIDVIMGAHVPFTYDSPEYLPFLVAINLLGGRGLSTGHLMRTIRERDGLTYGIYASPVGFTGKADGALEIWATFSPSTFEKAVSATKKEIDVFRTSGITEKSLRVKKEELVGRYAIGLGTSGGLAHTLHSIGVEGKPLSYIDEYPQLIRALTLENVKKVAALIPFDKLTVVAAGTFEKGSKKR